MEKQKEITFAINFILVNFVKNEISDQRNTAICVSKLWEKLLKNVTYLLLY